MLYGPKILSHAVFADHTDRRFLVPLPKCSRSVWEQRPLALGAPEKWARKRRHFHVLMKLNIGCGSLADVSGHDLSSLATPQNEGLRRRRGG